MMSAPKAKPISVPKEDPDIAAVKASVGDENALATLQQRLAAQKARTSRNSLIIDQSAGSTGSGLQL